MSSAKGVCACGGERRVRHGASLRCWALPAEHARCCPAPVFRAEASAGANWPSQQLRPPRDAPLQAGPPRRPSRLPDDLRPRVRQAGKQCRGDSSTSSSSIEALGWPWDALQSPPTTSTGSHASIVALATCRTPLPLHPSVTDGKACTAVRTVVRYIADTEKG